MIEVLFGLSVAIILLLGLSIHVQLQILAFVIKIHSEGQLVSVLISDKKNTAQEMEAIKARLPKILSVIALIAVISSVCAHREHVREIAFSNQYLDSTSMR